MRWIWPLVTAQIYRPLLARTAAGVADPDRSPAPEVGWRAGAAPESAANAKALKRRGSGLHRHQQRNQVIFFDLYLVMLLALFFGGAGKSKTHSGFWFN